MSKKSKKTPNKSKKTQTLEDLYVRCHSGGTKESSGVEFDNGLVKEIARANDFHNPFDATHIDNKRKLPDIYKEKDIFIVHLGKGRHKFVKGIEVGYHTFEGIKETKPWPYNKSVINELNTSEANILSVAFNQRIMSDFLYNDVAVTPKIYNSHRTKYNFKYRIGKEFVAATKQQIEIDMTTEKDGIISIFEAKNNFPDDFAVYQIYLPFLYYTEMKAEHKLQIKKINCCYFLRKKEKNGSTIRVYQYTFKDPYSMDSIKLIKNCEYKIKEN